jgi:hypothetical protein
LEKGKGQYKVAELHYMKRLARATLTILDEYQSQRPSVVPVYYAGSQYSTEEQIAQRPQASFSTSIVELIELNILAR